MSGDIRTKSTSVSRWRLFDTLQGQITVTFSGIIILIVAAVALLVQHDVQKTITASENRNARNILDQMFINAENEYKAYLLQKDTLYQERKESLKIITELALAEVEKAYEASASGSMTESAAKRSAMEAVRVMRYAKGSGYIWIQDTTLPLPNMLMHPTVPELEGMPGDHPLYFNALESGKNLLAEFVMKAQKGGGSAFLGYNWPKPTPDGLTEVQPKDSHVRIFEPWGWLIGTGVYIDDIDSACREHLDKMIKKISDNFRKIRLGETGYAYVFDGDYNIIVHPTLEGMSTSDVFNPATGRLLFEELAEAAGNPDGRIEYPWNKPNVPDDKYFDKVAYVKYLEPLDWYIGVSVYVDELHTAAATIRSKILWVSLVFLVLSILLAARIANGISRPLSKLAVAAEKMESHNMSAVDIPEGGSTETRFLRKCLLRMFKSLEADRELLQERSKELESRNRDLEQFNYTVSHDLKTPLITVNWFLGKLGQDIKAGKEDAVARDMERISIAIEKIYSLLNDMLVYSRVSHREMEKENVSLRTIVEEAISMIQGEYSKHLDSIHIQKDLPMVNGDSAALTEVMQNLLTNAIKYRNPEEDLSIEIGSEKDDENHLIYVRDNGIGIEPEFKEQIFKIFERINVHLPGNGIGLSIVHNIVTKHDGSVWVESAGKNQGCKFTLSLPR